MPSRTFKHHFVFFCLPAWGHIRPAAPVLSKLVQERPDILITVPVIGRFKDKLDKEIARYFDEENRALQEHIRAVQLSNFDGLEMQCWELLMKMYPVLMDRLLSCEPIVSCTGLTYPSAQKPSLCVVDTSLGSLGASFLSAKKLKVLCWSPTGLAAGLSISAPPEYGGFGNLEEDAEALAKKKNIPIRAATVEILLSANDTTRNIAGLPTAYGYEFNGDLDTPGCRDRWVDLARKMSTFVRNCDGAILANSSILEEGSLKAYRQWFKDLGKSCYAFGPCMIPDQAATDHEEYTRGRGVIDFVDNIYRSHGKHSLVYMSFGTVEFPSGETPWLLIDIILDMKIPLVFAMPHGDTYENRLPKDLQIRLNSSDLAVVVKWAPQHTILKHPATGIFFTHGGHGSLTEALVSGVPMIVWPLQSDQPFNCMNLTLNLKVAYQLLEVQNRQSLKPLYRGHQPTGTKTAIDCEFRQVLKDAFGEDGAVKRKIAQELGRRLKETWQENGEALSELRRFSRENFC